METIDKIQYVLNNLCLPVSLFLFVVALIFKFTHPTNGDEEEQDESDTTPIR